MNDAPPSLSTIEVALIMAVGLLGTLVRLADSPPQTIARAAWLLVAGLGLATGGWLIARALDLDGWWALAFAWIFGALGSEIALRIVRQWLDRIVPERTNR